MINPEDRAHQGRPAQRRDRPGRHRRAGRPAGPGGRGGGDGVDLAAQRHEDAAGQTPRLTVTQDAVIKDLVKCGYLKSADIADRFGDQSSSIRLSTRISSGRAASSRRTKFNSDDEFRKTASVMKLVLNGFAGAGCDHDGRLRLPRRPPRRGRGQGLPGRTLHGRLPRVRGARRRAADDVRLQRRLAVEQRRDRRHRGRPRQGRVDQRQPVDGRLVLPRLQPRRTGATARRNTRHGRRGTSSSATSGAMHRWKPRPRRRPTT